MKNKPILIFLIVSFGVAWLLWIASSNTAFYHYQIISVVSMWTPTLGYFVTKKVCGENASLSQKIMPKLNKKDVKYYLFAWFFPMIAMFLGMLIYFLIFPKQFDPTFSYVKSMLDSLGEKAQISPLVFLLSMLIAGVTIGPFINSFIALGEEIGWRGYLYPTLEKRFSPVKAHIIMGIIWGVWHTPINLTGYNYGKSYPAFPFVGIVAMCVFCFSAGVLLSFVAEKTKSIYFAGVMHGAINAISAFSIYLQRSEFVNGRFTVLGPCMNGFLAGLPLFITAVILMIKESKQSK